MEAPLSGGMPLQAELRAQLKRKARSAARTEADARHKDFSKYWQTKRSPNDQGGDNKYTRGRGFIVVPVYVGSAEHPEAPPDISEVLSGIRQHQFAMYANLRIVLGGDKKTQVLYRTFICERFVLDSQREFSILSRAAFERLQHKIDADT